MSRVVLFSNTGHRVLDTIVKPEDLEPGEELVLKEGLKTDLMHLGREKGPSLSLIKELITDMIMDKKVVGYHLPNKLNDIGIMKEFPKNGLMITNMFDIAKIFNRDPGM